MGTFSLARSCYETNQIVAGGGSRVLALALILATMMMSLIDMPNKVLAADEGYHLYFYSNPETTGKDATITDLSNGRTYRYFGLGEIPCIVASDGSIWRPKQPITLNGKSDGTIIQSSGYCSKYDDSPKDNIAHMLVARSSMTDEAYVDREGYFWVKSQVSDSFGLALRAPFSEYDFYAVVKRPAGDTQGTEMADYYLLGKPRAQQTATYISQMPTTGAPVGLSSAGLAAVGLGLMGVFLGLMRRRDS